MTRPRRPDPPPLQTNDVLVVAVGTVAWAAVLVVLLVIGLDETDRWWLWVCAAGIVGGLFAMWYIPRLQRGRAAAEARRDARRQGPATTPVRRS
jgi:H+/Cl- antiporter ClcA